VLFFWFFFVCPSNNTSENLLSSVSQSLRWPCSLCRSECHFPSLARPRIWHQRSRSLISISRSWAERQRNREIYKVIFGYVNLEISAQSVWLHRSLISMEIEQGAQCLASIRQDLVRYGIDMVAQLRFSHIRQLAALLWCWIDEICWEMLVAQSSSICTATTVLDDSSALRDSFIVDFKTEFNVLEKDPDYFIGFVIQWDPIIGVIKLDPWKYLREIVAKYDMSGLHGDESSHNLCQQIAGSLNFAAQLRPELMFSVSQMSRVMSCPAQ